MDQVKLTAYIDTEIADAIIDDHGTGALAIVTAYYIYDAQGASKVGGEVWMGRAKVFVAYCADQATAIQVKNRIMQLTPPGKSIGFELADAEVYVFTEEVR